MTEELKKIKKKYGEKMSHLCRELFPTILEKEGLLIRLLQDHFYESTALYNDIIEQEKEEEFKNYIYSLIDVQKGISIPQSKKPSEILKEAGYTLYKCKTEEEIQHFKKYYAENEELCTFRGGRLNSCYVFFAVRNDANNLKRSDFQNPERQDLYGTSVISIQFSKGDTNTLSIKNRYNHRVNNPDATFSNNLDLIRGGLTKSFEREYNLNILSGNSKFELDGYVLANDGKYYKYNLETDNIYYCPNNIIIDNFEVKKFDSSRYLIIDKFLLDLKEKQIKSYTSDKKESFPNSLTGISKVEIKKSKKGKEIVIDFNEEEKERVFIEIDDLNNIIGLNNPNIKTVGNYFLFHNQKLTRLEAPNLTAVGSCFLYGNKALTNLELPNLTTVGSSFMSLNELLIELKAPNLTTISHCFLRDNQVLTKLEFPKLKTIGSQFLYKNQVLTKLEFPELMEIDMEFMPRNKRLAKLEFPKLKTVRDNFLHDNELLTVFIAPELRIINNSFLPNNKFLTVFIAPSLRSVGMFFLESNPKLAKEIVDSINERKKKI